MFKNKKGLVLVLIALLSFLGFLDAVYLTITHYQNILPPCSLKLGCEKVLTSQYSTIIGIPISLLGSIYYLTVGIIAIQLLQNKKRFLIQSLFLATISGFVISVTLFLIQAFVLHSFCQYCLLSELISTLLLTLSIFLLRLRHEPSTKDKPPSS